MDGSSGGSDRRRLGDSTRSCRTSDCNRTAAHPLVSRPAAGDVEDAASRERAFFRGEPSDKRRDLFDEDKPADRDLRQHVVDLSLGHLGEISVRAAAGVTQLTRMPVPASSLPRDFVNPITPAFAAE